MDTRFPFKGEHGDRAPFCANCHNLLGPVLSSPGRFTAFPPSNDNWLNRYKG